MLLFGATALVLGLRALQSHAAPIAQQAQPPAAGGSGYWLAEIKHQGVAPFNNDTGYQVFRNVKELGVMGDGATDDTEALNKILADGARCGGSNPRCDSSTTTPAILYFPAGTYMISKPLLQYYYTQMIGDPHNMPVLKATPEFEGMGLIDADPYIYEEGPLNGANWFTNQNNFYRQIRNFVIDITDAKATSAIHWQVSQATSLQNIVFNMAPKDGAGKDQKGIFMDNGSGGFMTDLVFNGGAIGAFLGSQQFTTRNMTFNDCGAAIYMNWNWLWTMKSISINNCDVGVDMANNPTNQTVGSVLMMDSKFVNTPVGFNTSFSENSIPHTGGTLVIDNVDFTGCTDAVQDASGAQILAGGSQVEAWSQGNAFAVGGELGRVQGPITGQPQKPASMIDSSGGFFERSKPQYQDVPVSNFVSLKDKGAIGDGATDDTDAIQAAIDGLTEGQVLFVDHGAYLITKTVTIPAEKNVRIVGEIYPMFFATGEFFGNMDDPKPAFKVGENSGDKGTFEMSDCIIATQGPAPGGILMEWNINSEEQGGAGLWDTHFRVGGYAGTELQSDKCSKNPNVTHDANPECIGAFMKLHITRDANAYLENVWLWTADHELDLKDHNQIDIYNGRGMLVESQGPVWMWGTASEHSVLSQYHLQGAKDVFMGAIQTETPYFQPNPPASTPFTVNPKYFDPDFTQGETDGSAWGVRIIDSESIWLYGTGTYSFFSNYDQECVPNQNCQQHLNEINNSTNVNWFGMSTKASVNMVTVDGQGVVKDEDNRSNFCATLGIFALR